ncbi:MAPEG family protein [Aurantiacibacter flavus]|uniref:MAPEG family protein n=1 Tax=Aurantiacibacter flavus TaxID=3145232 RepID=A0ABV0CWK6_9SPHN
MAALINLWLAIRCGKARIEAKAMHGDGGHPLLLKRMRAQANFVEYTPFALLLVLGLELSGHAGWPLALTASLFLIGRVSHGLGMDADIAGPLRQAGMALTFLPLLGLIAAALLAAFGLI